MSLLPLVRLAYVLARRRIMADWRLELTMAVGMVLTVALMAGGVIYSAFLEEAALQRELANTQPRDTNLTLRIFYPLDPAEQQRAERFVQERAEPKMKPYIRGSAALIQSSTFYYQGLTDPEVPETSRPRGKFQYISDLDKHARLVAGRYPQSGGDVIEVAIEQKGTELLPLSLGQEVTLFPAVVVQQPVPIQARIVGLIEVTDPQEEFWYAASEVFSYQGSSWTWVPMFTTPENVVDKLAETFRGMHTDASWFFYLDRAGLRGWEAGGLAAAVRSIQQDVKSNLRTGSTATSIPQVLGRYAEQVTLARVPLMLMVFFGIVILMYYLFLVSVLTVRARSQEIALLKSRGATTLQVTLLMVIEGLLLAVPAVFLGPFISLAVVSTIGKVVTTAAPEASVVPVALSQRAFLLGAGGAFLSLATLTVATLLTARHGIVEFRQVGARPPRMPLVHRYYLDFLFLALVGVVWWQIQQQGAFLVRPLGSAGLKIDYSLLLGPIMGFLALGLLVLRLFPWFLNLVARSTDPVGSVWLVQGLRRVARDPIMPGALVLLLMLATALGVVGGSFDSTLDQSQVDRAMYVAGTDMRVGLSASNTSLLSSYFDRGRSAAFLSSPDQFAPAFRTTASMSTASFGEPIDVLAVDADKFHQVAWYREDFSQEPLESLMEKLRPPEGSSGGIQLPTGTTGLSIWVRPSRPFNQVILAAKVRDSQGQYANFAFGYTVQREDQVERRFTLSFNDWRRLETTFSEDSVFSSGRRRFGSSYMAPPFTLEAIFVTFQDSREAGAVYLDDLVALTGLQRHEEPLYDFQSSAGWHVVEDYSSPGLYSLEVSESVVREGRSRSSAFFWPAGGLGAVGIRPGPPEQPLPAIVSKSLLGRAEASVGDQLLVNIGGTAIPVKVAGVVDFFPTLFPGNAPFAIMDVHSLLAFMNLRTVRLPQTVNELWVKLDPQGMGSDGFTRVLQGHGVRISGVTLASDIVQNRLSHPMLSAGWSGLLSLSFLTVAVASAFSVILYSYMDVRQRQTEFALLRTLGFSRRQVNGVVWLALVLMVVCGIAVGTWAGHQIATALLPLLEVAEEGTRVTPPMALQTNWKSILWYYLVLALVGAVTAAVLAMLLVRTRIYQVLRIGEAG